MKINLKMKIKKKPKACKAEAVCREDGQMRRVSAIVRIADAVIRAILSMIVVLCFASCSSISGYSEPEDRYIVSAIGFDYVGGALEASVQIVGDEGKENLIRSGRGENVRQAMGHIEGADSRQLEISHCALILIGDSVEKKDLSDIFEYCRKNNDITVGVKVASAHNAKELLSLEDGYELLCAWHTVQMMAVTNKDTDGMPVVLFDGTVNMRTVRLLREEGIPVYQKLGE